MQFPADPSFDTDPTPIIHFQAEDTDFMLLEPDRVVAWLKRVIIAEQATLLSLNYIFCSDDYLHRINIEYLQHDTYTDIITFPFADPPNLEGDIFISIDRVRENANTYGADFEEELRRVMAHGLLHLCGYPDKTAVEAERMRQKEAEALAMWS